MSINQFALFLKENADELVANAREKGYDFDETDIKKCLLNDEDFEGVAGGSATVKFGFEEERADEAEAVRARGENRVIIVNEQDSNARMTVASETAKENVRADAGIFVGTEKDTK